MTSQCCRLQIWQWWYCDEWGSTVVGVQYEEQGTQMCHAGNRIKCGRDEGHMIQTSLSMHFSTRVSTTGWSYRQVAGCIFFFFLLPFFGKGTVMGGTPQSEQRSVSAPLLPFLKNQQPNLKKLSRYMLGFLLLLLFFPFPDWKLWWVMLLDFIRVLNTSHANNCESKCYPKFENWSSK